MVPKNNKPETIKIYLDQIRTGEMGSEGYITPCITAFTAYMKNFMGGELTEREKICLQRCPDGRTNLKTIASCLEYESLSHDGLLKATFKL